MEFDQEQAALARLTTERPRRPDRTARSSGLRIPAVVLSVVALFFPSILQGQEIVREALSSFPADTQQFTYANLDQMRSLSNYPQIHQKLLTSQLRSFEEFLRSGGNDPEKDVDEVVLGWRSQAGLNAGGIFGLAEGRFHPDEAEKYYDRAKLPTTKYADVRLYPFGSTGDRAQLFFGFLSESLGAFGDLSQLKAVLDVRTGARSSLESNATFAGWEAELEGSGAQWGICMGKAAAGHASQWLTFGAQPSVDFSSLLGPVQAVLYRLDFGTDLSIRLSVVCQSGETAAALAKILLLLRDSRQPSATPNASPEVASFLESLEVNANGSRVELSGSAPVGLVGVLNR